MFKRTLLMCAVSMFCARQGKAVEIDAGSLEFDSETLRSLGIDPTVSSYFAEKSRFMPGQTTVTLKVNGQNKGRVLAHFQRQGELCFDKSLMEHAHIRIPSDYQKGCYDYLKQHPKPS